MPEIVRNFLWDRLGVHTKLSHDHAGINTVTGGEGPGWCFEWHGFGLNLTIFLGRTPPDPEEQQADA